MPSRRRLLGRAGAGALAAVAGCSAPRESGGPSAICSASLSGGDVAFALTPQVTPTGSGDDGAAPGLAVLVVPIRQATIEAENLDLVQVFDGDRVRYRIPLSADDDPVGEG